jgi:hypothetical protein
MKGLHSEVIEVIKAELQAVLNILTEHDFQNAFKKWQKHWSFMWKWTTSRVLVTSRPKAIF